MDFLTAVFYLDGAFLAIAIGAMLIRIGASIFADLSILGESAERLGQNAMAVSDLAASIGIALMVAILFIGSFTGA